MSAEDPNGERDELIRRKVAAPLRPAIPDDSDVGTGTTPTVRVDIETEPQALEAAVAHAEGVGADVISSHHRLVIADIPGDLLPALVEGDAIRKVDRHQEPEELATTQGVETSGADLLHDIGLTGDGATIAVIDSQFNRENDKYEDQVVGEIGNAIYDEDDEDFSTGFHGTKSAEVVSDMAPDADMILASTAGESLDSILTTLEDHDNNPWDFVDVATMSLGWPPSVRPDGTDSRSDRIRNFTSGDRLFSTAAGNEASGDHWDGEFQDTNGNDLMEFDDAGTERFQVNKSVGDDEDPEDVGGAINVHWDLDWDTAGEEYEVRMYDAASGGTELASSRTTNPHERVTVPETEATSVYLEIENFDGNGDEHFDIYTSSNNQLSFPVSTPERSILIPATTTDDNTLTVAAVIHHNENLAGYSSQGPTLDGRRGIDIAGPTHVSLSDFGFSGTSAATPHVGGAIAILSDPSLGYSRDDIREALLDAGRGIGDPSVSEPGPNNTKIGFGYLQVRTARDLLESIMVTLEEDWTFDTGSRLQYSRPVVANGEVFAGGLGEDVFALDRAAGTENWAVSRSGALSDSTPTLWDGRLFVGSGGGVLYDIEIASEAGTLLFTTDSAITSSPVVLEDVNGQDLVIFGTNDGWVIAVDTAGGTPVWTTGLPGPVYTDLAAGGGLVAVTTRDGLLSVLDPASNGDVRWDEQTTVHPEFWASSPVIYDGKVLVAGDSVRAFDLTTGTQEWEVDYLADGASTPAVDPNTDTVYVGATDGTIHAIDIDGTPQWSESYGPDGPITTPAVAEERLVAATLDGPMELIDTRLDEGAVIASTDPAIETLGGAVIEDNDVFFGSEDDNVYAYRGDPP